MLCRCRVSCMHADGDKDLELCHMAGTRHPFFFCVSWWTRSSCLLCFSLIYCDIHSSAWRRTVGDLEDSSHMCFTAVWCYCEYSAYQWTLACSSALTLQQELIHFKPGSLYSPNIHRVVERNAELTFLFFGAYHWYYSCVSVNVRLQGRLLQSSSL